MGNKLYWFYFRIFIKIQMILRNMREIFSNIFTVLITITFSFIIALCVGSWYGLILGVYLMYNILYDKNYKASKVMFNQNEDDINKVYKFTPGKIYDVIRQDNVSFYLKNDFGQLDEVVRTRFTIVEKKYIVEEKQK